ncbi:MAG: hypothetical protein PHD54_15100 [Desulfuromonadaceae bacterium]|nr:hypothetical protein [Desulfuromonadaceae bacterium]
MPTVERPPPSLLTALATNWSYGGVIICLFGAFYLADPPSEPIGLIIILAGSMMVLVGFIRTRRLCMYGLEVDATCTRTRGYKGIPILTLSYVFKDLPYKTKLEVDIIRAFGPRLHLGGTGVVKLIIDPNSSKRVLLKNQFYPPAPAKK